MDHEELDVRRSGERVPAVKYAEVVRVEDGLRFRGASMPVSYRAEDCAVCARLLGVWGAEAPPHDVPSLDCSCGFYGLKELGSQFQAQATPFVLDVELAGTVIACEFGYRAERIRVLGVGAMRTCRRWGVSPRWLDDEDVQPCGPAAVLVSDRHVPSIDRMPPLNPWCEGCAGSPVGDGRVREVWTLGEVGQQLGTDVSWLGDGGT